MNRDFARERYPEQGCRRPGTPRALRSVFPDLCVLSSLSRRRSRLCREPDRTRLSTEASSRMPNRRAMLTRDAASRAKWARHVLPSAIEPTPLADAGRCISCPNSSYLFGQSVSAFVPSHASLDSALLQNHAVSDQLQPHGFRVFLISLRTLD